MDVTVQIRDDRARRRGAVGDLPASRAASAGCRRVQLRRLTKPDLRRLLGFETGHQIDEFLKAYQVFEEYTLEDLESEREGLRRLGF